LRYRTCLNLNLPFSFELIKIGILFSISFHLNMGSFGYPLVNPATKVILSLERKKVLEKFFPN
ncbi:MAG: hypothetical protein LUD70_20465, partial [Bacteroides ovatus]|nr:hypothetical protein [Bacteroides ovatus]